MIKAPIYLYFIGPLFMLIIFRLLGFDGLYGQDAYEYLRYSKALRDFLITGNSPGDYFWPVAYPFTGALLSLIIPDTSLCLQLISIVSISVACLYTAKLIQLIFPKEANKSYVFIALFLLGSPFMIRFGLSVMADTFTLATLVVGVYHIFRFTRFNRVRALYWASFFLSISFMSRYAVILLFLPPGLYALYCTYKHKTKWYFIPIIILIGLVPLIPHILIRIENPIGFIFHDWLTQWSMENMIKRGFTTRDGTTIYTLANILYAFGGLFHPRYFFAGIIIVLIAFRKFKFTIEIKILLTALLIYLFFLAGIPYQNNRFLLLALPFLLIIYFSPTISFIGQIKKKGTTIFVTVIMLIQTTLFTVGFQKVLQRSALEKEIYQYVINHESRPIYTMDMDVSLKGRGYSFPIYNIFTNYYDEPDTSAWVIFNQKVFSEQWKGMNPMKNWEHFNAKYKLKQIKIFDKDWAIYEFE